MRTKIVDLNQSIIRKIYIYNYSEQRGFKKKIHIVEICEFNLYKFSYLRLNLSLLYSLKLDK